MLMVCVFSDAPGVPYHWRESKPQYSNPIGLVSFISIPVRERGFCLMDKEVAYRAEPHVIPLGNNHPKFGINFYALGPEFIILGIFIALAFIARRCIKRSSKTLVRRLWRTMFIIAIIFVVGFVVFVTWASLRRFGLLGM